MMVNLLARGRLAARVIRARSRDIRYGLSLITLLLFIPIVIILVVRELLKPLPNVKWSICAESSKKIGLNSGSCNRLRLDIPPNSPEVSPVSGKYAENMETPRKLAEFLVLPRVGDTIESIKDCRTKTGDVKWTLVNLIKSSIGNTARRKAIRSTWGAVKIINGLRIVNVFVVGKTANVRMQASLKRESALHGDILQFDKEDSVKTVPEKVLAGMQWSSDSLQSDTLYSSMDDDIVVHVPNLATYLRREFLEPESCSASKKRRKKLRDRPCLEDLPLLCVYSYQSEDIPARNAKSKWYISYDDFPDRQWPAYCRGGMYIAPVKMVDALFRVSRSTEHLYLDDVWITGFMRRKLGMDDRNIVPAPHSIRHETLFYGKSDTYSDILLQHLWGNMADGADIPQQIGQLWDNWNVVLDMENVCVATAYPHKEFA